VTAEPPSSGGGSTRLTRALLLVPPALVLAVAALTPTSALYPDQRDVSLYLGYAHAMVSGAAPYRDFALEYPPGGLIPMVVPYLAGLSADLSLDAYKVLFAGWEAALLLVLGVVLQRIAERVGLPNEGRWTAVRLALLTIGAILAIAWRYDLFPALLTAVAVWAAIERRLAWVAVMLGIGTLAKLYPVVLLPALAVPWIVPLDIGRLIRLGAMFGLTVIAGLLPFVAVAGNEAFAFVQYQVGRGLQIESIGGGAVLLAGLVTGDPPALSFGFGAIQVEGELAHSILGVLPLITGAVFVSLGLLGLRRVRADVSGDDDIAPSTLVALASASLLVLLVTSKVYSIQYVVWIVPFLALLRGRVFWVGLAVVALTMPIHPILYTDLVRQDALPVLVLNLRNALVLALTAWLLVDLARSPLARGFGRIAEPATAASGAGRS